MIRFFLFFLERYFGRVADDRLERFSTAHIASLQAYPRFAHLAAPTERAFQAYFGARSGQDRTATQRTGLTQAVQDRLEEFQALTSRHAGAIISRWGKESLEYRRFYPHGVTEYRQANLQSIGVLMERYAEVLEEFRSALPEHVVADFLAPIPKDADPHGSEGGIILRFRALRALQLSAKGGVEQTRRERTGTRTDLEDQIMENVLTIALAVLREDKESKLQALKLFPQALLSKPKRKADTEPGTIKKKATQPADAAAEENGGTAAGSAEEAETTGHSAAAKDQTGRVPASAGSSQGTDAETDAAAHAAVTASRTTSVEVEETEEAPAASRAQTVEAKKDEEGALPS